MILGLPVYADSVVPEQLRSTGQSLVTLVGPCFAGVFSNLTAGWLIGAFGPAAPARVSGVLALLTVLALPWLLPAPFRRDPSSTTPGSRARADARDPPR